MVCIESHATVQDVAGPVESFGFVSVVNSRMVSELSSVKFELKIEERTFILSGYHAMEFLASSFHYPVFAYAGIKKRTIGREQEY